MSDTFPTPPADDRTIPLDGGSPYDHLPDVGTGTWDIPPPPPPPRRNGTFGLFFAAIAGGLTVLVVIGLLMLVGNFPTIQAAKGGVPSTTTAPRPTFTAIPTATLVPPTNTPVPVFGDLQVEPTQIDSSCRADTKSSIVITNVGKGALNWTANSSANALMITPNQGTLKPGQSMNIDLARLFHPTTLTIAAPGALHAPKNVNITCNNGDN